MEAENSGIPDPVNHLTTEWLSSQPPWVLRHSRLELEKPIPPQNCLTEDKTETEALGGWEDSLADQDASLASPELSTLPTGGPPEESGVRVGLPGRGGGESLQSGFLPGHPPPPQRPATGEGQPGPEPPMWPSQQACGGPPRRVNATTVLGLGEGTPRPAGASQ